ncbi:unnamed protein product [Pleuronectes platessa]|uniref:Uncharacterized protein n=1 Tax=Pleuronectes platessa TaxID=8262 RepID=A0A9N7U9Q8_PLEPL|nr:unnamed protein product [Pleuronectes platessa]
MSLPPQQEHVIAIEDVELLHSGCLWKSMWAIMMERRGGGGEKVPQGSGGLLSSTAANSITVHMNGWLVPHQCCGLMSKDRQDSDLLPGPGIQIRGGNVRRHIRGSSSGLRGKWQKSPGIKMEQGRKSLGEIFISGTEREPLPLVAPDLCHCSISSSSLCSVHRSSPPPPPPPPLRVTFTPPSSHVRFSTHLTSLPDLCKTLQTRN